jgi:Family of unknown function (DUF5723)
MKKILLLHLAFISVLQVFSQTMPYTVVGRGVGTTFVTDYHSLGINSSALGWKSDYDGKKITLSTGESYIFFQSDSLNKQKFKNFGDLIRTQVTNKTIDTASIQSILNSTVGYAKAGVNTRANLLWLGASYKTNRIGGFAFSMTEDYGFSGKLNTSNAALFFQGNWQNLIDSASTVVNGDSLRVAFSQNLGADTASGIYSIHLTNPFDINNYTLGTSVGLVWNRNYNFGYGVKLLGKDSTFAVYGGLGFRFIQSMAYYDLKSDASGLNVNSSLSPTSLNFDGLITQVNPFNFSTIGGFFSKPVGKGFGVDLSASVIIWDKIRVAAAVNNIGSVKYKNFKYKGNTALPQEIAISNFDPENSAANVQALLAGSQLLTFEGEEEITVANASNFRFGASFRPIKQLHVGIDFVAPFDKENPLAQQNGIFALGIDFRPVKFLSLNAGFINGGIYQGYIPAGINFILGEGRYEFGISSQDIVQFISKNGNSVSAAFGFARFRF